MGGISTIGGVQASPPEYISAQRVGAGWIGDPSANGGLLRGTSK